MALALTLTGAVASSASAQIRGEGTMLVRQSTDCSGTGTTSTVYFPFSVLFTGFEPGETGEVTAFTQPGGEQVGHRTVTVDEQGNRCELVEGTVPPGQYKLVYDFESGTGKQKVIRLVAPPGGSASPSRHRERGAIGQRERLRHSHPVALRSADARTVAISEHAAAWHAIVG